MVRADIVTAKLAELGGRIVRVRAHTPASADALRSNDMVFAAASRGVGDLDAFAAETAAWLQARIAQH